MKTPDLWLEKLVESLETTIEQGKASSDDIKHNISALLKSQLTKLDVVSREEFDAQQAILEKSRKEIESVKQELADLETAIAALNTLRDEN